MLLESTAEAGKQALTKALKFIDKVVDRSCTKELKILMKKIDFQKQATAMMKFVKKASTGDIKEMLMSGGMNAERAAKCARAIVKCENLGGRYVKAIEKGLAKGLYQGMETHIGSAFKKAFGEEFSQAAERLAKQFNLEKASLQAMKETAEKACARVTERVLQEKAREIARKVVKEAGLGERSLWEKLKRLLAFLPDGVDAGTKKALPVLAYVTKKSADVGIQIYRYS